MPLALEPQMRKVLHPGTRLGHGSLALAVLGTGLITQYCVMSQRVRGGWYLGWGRGRMLWLLDWAGDYNTA